MDFDTYDTPNAEELLRTATARRRSDSADRRALWTEGYGAVGFLVVAGALVLLVHSSRAFSVPALAVTVVAYLVAARVQFPVGAGWTRPTQIAFVPMLFLLPITLVPFVVMGCLVLDLTPQLVRGKLSPTRLFALIGDSMYTLGPVLVLVLAHEQRFAWAHWPIYIVAFAAQVGFDLFGYISRSWFAEGTLPTAHIQVAWCYLTDACLSCAALLVASSADRRPALVLLSLPLIGLLGLFARERSARMDNTLALSTAYRGTAMLLGDVIEDDDEYTGIHSRAVVDLAMAVASRLRLDPVAKRNVEFGALLHDVGKIRVPKEIIHKPGHLDEAEWEIVRQHTVFGEQMLRRVGGTLSSVGKVVRHSHERWDGTGYPDGLVGEQIPIEARIVCACDAFNAMTTNRSYRRALPLAEAIEELERCGGRQFDPRVVTALLREVAEHPPAPAPSVPAAPDHAAEVLRPVALTAAASDYGAVAAQTPVSVSSPASSAAVS